MKAARSALGALAKLVLLLHLLPTMIFFYWFLLGSLPTLPLWWLLGQSRFDQVQDAALVLMLAGSCVAGVSAALWLRGRHAGELERIAGESWFGRCFARAVPLSGALYLPLVGLVLAIHFIPDQFEPGMGGELGVFWAVGGTLLAGLTFDLSSLVLIEPPGLRGLTRGADAIVVLADAAITIVAVKAFLELLVDTRAPLIPPRGAVAVWRPPDAFDPFLRHLYGWFLTSWFVMLSCSAMFVLAAR